MNNLADGQWHRMHPATPLLRGGAALIAILAIVFANLREQLIGWIAHVPDGASQGDPVSQIMRHGWGLWAALGVLAFLGLVTAWYRLTWRMTEFRVGADAVELRSGVLNRQNRQARLDRIQGVNVHRTLFARIFGAARLEIVVAGNDANLHLQYLHSAAAEELRRQILGISHRVIAAEAAAVDALPGAAAGAAGSAAPADLGAILEARADEFLTPADLHPDAATPDSVVKVHPGRLIGSIVLSPFTLVLVALVVWLAFEVVRGNYYLLVAVIPTVFGLFTGYSRRFGRLARYTVSGSADGVRVGYGLLATSSETIPAGRIHAVGVSQPLMWRPFGWWAIRINRAGRGKQRGQAENASVVLPVGSLEDVARVLPLLLPASPAASLDLLMNATARYSRTAPPIFSRAPRAAMWLHPFAWRRIGYAYVGDTVALREGFIDRSLTFVPLARVQSVAVRQGPIHRWLGLAQVAVHTVDGRIRPRLAAIGLTAGEQLFDQLASSAVLLASRDAKG
ncbi:MAG: PH domain-containing protein [Microbacteriaceae bacterium]|nr:PH domain-containing protein [Microbacteriaceae bacterium]MCL2796079.1 PH domain-containing protein [Microbacteriaceae bacterium]